MTVQIKVLLVGGTSHVGKSTLAARLAAPLGWNVRSTDQFARHPGRPWRDDEASVPLDVVDHYSSGSAVSRVDSVVRHYRENVWPIAEAVVRSHLNNPFDPCLVLEGSALLPDLVNASLVEGFRAVWLTAPDAVIRARILENSRFAARSAIEKRLIEAFVERALDFDRAIVESTGRHGHRLLDASSSDVLPELLRLVPAR